jgi:hypothetical protein
VLLGAVLVYFSFPKVEREKELLARYHAEDVDPRVPAARPPEARAGDDLKGGH